jgi:Fur family ferric uptake transcriptional regulator
MRTERDILDDHLDSQGLKKTQQRYAILDTFLANPGHISAYELHALLRKRHQGIGFSTVYRTLRLFTECRLAHEVNFGDGQARFEKAFHRDNHGHLICSKCGHTEEFDAPSIAKTETQISEKHGYKILGFKFEIYGLCKKCQN